MSDDYSEALKKITTLLHFQVVYLYLYVDQNDGAMQYYRVAVTNQQVSLPRPKDKPEIENYLGFNLWGGVGYSRKAYTGARLSALNTLSAFATILSMLGYEVFVNNRLYDPLEKIKWDELVGEKETA